MAGTTKYANERLFLTPDAPIDDGNSVFWGVVLPASPVEIQALLDGVWSMLGEDNNWFNYGDMTNEETAQFYRNVQIVTNLCQFIVDNCLTDVGFMDALMQKLGERGLGAGGGGTNEVNDGISGMLLYDGGDCTDNEHYGVCYEIVAYLDRQAVDGLDSLQDGSNELLTALDLLGNIPVLNIITSAIFDSATELAKYFVDEIVSSYNAAYTLTVQEAIACKIFENSDCEITLDNVIAGYESYIGDVLTLPTGRDFLEIVQWLASLDDLLDTMIVATIHWFILQVFNHGSVFFNAPVRGLVIASATASPIPLPEDCGGWSCYEWDFTTNAQGWAVWSTGDRPYGQYSSGVGWQCTYDSLSGNFSNRIYIENLGWAVTSDFHRIECDVIPTAGGSGRDAGGGALSGTTTVNGDALLPNTTINSTLQTVACEFEATGNGIRVYFSTDVGGALDADALTIQTIRLYYTDGTPEDGSAC